jgi:hypothetical protein
MDEQPTCGKGLAHHSILPAKLGALMAAVADVLEAHQAALDLSDANAKREHDAYAELADSHRVIAAHLEATARRMAGYRELPMGRHDMTVMMSQKPAEAFSRLVAIEDELFSMLRARLEEHRAMLSEMQTARDSS